MCPVRQDPATGAARRGSQKWLQHFVAEAPDALRPPTFPPMKWISPIPDSRFREYSDGAFLDALGLGNLKPALAEFWPRGGAVWDGLALAGGAPVLVEAKAHVAEFFSSPCAAEADTSRLRIRDSLVACKRALGADDRSDWMRCFYQYANRLAHLWWLHEQDIRAHLLLVNFVGDNDMNGPDSRDAWDAVERAADYALGIRRGHPLSAFVHHVHPDVRLLPS
jgi:hypothetical protein